MADAVIAADAADPVRLLAALAVVTVVAWLGAEGMRRLRQPGIMGELLAGILLGPTVLGALAPGLSDLLFPDQVIVALGSIAQVGLVLFMFLVGSEVSLDHLRGQGRRALAISQAGIIGPLVLGVALGWTAHGHFGEGSDRLSFSLFLGVAMAITAFPVLAGILREVGLLGKPIGALAMTCAAIDDVSAWILLAVAVAVASSSSALDVLDTLAATAAAVLAAWFVVRPLLARLPRLPLPVCLGWALAAAWITELIGIHAIFGAFMAGVALPRGDRRPPVERIEPLIVGLLLPVFFVVTGLVTRFGLVVGVDSVLLLSAVLAVAVAGKLGGCYGAGRLTGLDRDQALAIGVLMNTRGLTEVVILTVGLELGLIGARVFAIMVIMALVTTLAARPSLDRLRSRGMTV